MQRTPVIFLVAKHLLWAEHEYTEPIRAVPLGKARNVHEGSDVTLVAWGNTIEKSLEALKKIGNEISVELIDLRSIVPWDAAAIEESVRKNAQAGCGSGGHGKLQRGSDDYLSRHWQPRALERIAQPPILVSKPNVVIGYNPIYEYAALPDVERIVTAIRRSISTRHERAAVAGIGDSGRAVAKPEVAMPRSPISATTVNYRTTRPKHHPSL